MPTAKGGVLVARDRTSGIANPLARASYDYQRSWATRARGEILRGLPYPLKRALKTILYLSLDGLDLALGRRGDLVPPRHLNFAGDGNFVASGDEFLRYFIDLGELQPNSRVLEVGCGVGRMARPLTKYLTSGSYEGMDIVPRGIRWCRENITARYGRFRFHLADVYNLMYNPSGHLKPTEYIFPFDGNEFDFVFLTSGFTHMLTADMEHYLNEIARTLRCRGKFLITFFLLNDKTRELSRAGVSSLDFQFPRENCYIDDEKVPEHAVAFEEAYVLAAFQKMGLEVERIEHGAWCGETNSMSYQDILIGRKI
jgi:ubiquinone/menaquinone biosynthesis C-methylase UbiE